MPTLRGPGAPVTRSSPTVSMTASTFPAANASMDGVYSNHENSTSTPASLNQPFWMPISNAVHPGQSEKAVFRGGPFAAGGAPAGSALAEPAATMATNNFETTIVETILLRRALAFVICPEAIEGACPGDCGIVNVTKTVAVVASRRNFAGATERIW